MSVSRLRLWPGISGMPTRLVQWSLAAMLMITLAGCGCSMFSSATRCQVKDAGLIAVLLPVIAVDRVGESLSDGRKQREQRSLVLAGHPVATIDCMRWCDGYSHLRDSEALAHLSVRHIIDWWDASPSPDQLPTLLYAHLMQGRYLMVQTPVEAAQHWKRGAQLAADPRIAGARALTTADGYQHMRRSDLDRWGVELAERLLVLRYQGRDGNPADHSVLGPECRPVSAWPPAWMNARDSQDSMEKACDYGYIQVFESLPPMRTPTKNS